MYLIKGWLSLIFIQLVYPPMSKEENVAIFRWYRHDFSCRNIGQTIFRDFSSIYRLVNAGQQSQRATVHLPKQIASEGIWTPNLLVWGSAFLPSGLTRPYDIKCIKHIYTWSPYIKKMLKEYFKEQINYNYFIIKSKIFF